MSKYLVLKLQIACSISFFFQFTNDQNLFAWFLLFDDDFIVNWSKNPEAIALVLKSNSTWCLICYFKAREHTRNGKFMIFFGYLNFKLDHKLEQFFSIKLLFFPRIFREQSHAITKMWYNHSIFLTFSSVDEITKVKIGGERQQIGHSRNVKRNTWKEFKCTSKAAHIFSLNYAQWMIVTLLNMHC